MPAEIDDELWTAIGDPTRRRLLDLLLSNGPGTASGLSRELPVSRQAVAKQLAVLERAGLVVATASSREVRFGVDPEQFARAVDQLSAVGQAWDRRLHRIKAIAESVQKERDADQALPQRADEA
ncbi:helix-turn-helix transcriptional regulator [Microbacterium sp. NEAU-LLC]|uniref:Helix-turn-helix transcriptional regulator n=1 Tax=Microbacterium helvum TaxID=2773713 RepID=A0ABR8NTJ6_9MICO|nr:helix-turn-helix domain-containing protein [Microbacterium helvum]MBD3943072.1 helix-turn-helix transcriptional regulator [Microbacterium helvum]